MFVTDSAEGSTRLIKTLPAGYPDAQFESVNVLDTICYFSILLNNSGRIEIWKTNLNNQNSILLKTNYNGFSMANLTRLGGFIYYISYGSNYELWRIDAITNVMTRVYEFSSGIGVPSKLTAINNTLCFVTSNITQFTSFKNKIYFAANDSLNGIELWRSGGTVNETKIFTKLNTSGASSSPSEINVINNQLFFSANTTYLGNELWKSDGSKNGTKLVKDIVTGTGSSFITFLSPFGNKMVFTIAPNDPAATKNLWLSDGTEQGTILLKETKAFSAYGEKINQIAVLNNNVLFAAKEGAFGEELWITDGTVAGTRQLKDINLNGASSPIFPTKRAILNDSLAFFQATDGVRGVELWKTNGTASGTEMLANIYPNDNPSILNYHIKQMTPVGNLLYFTADNTVNGSELWKTNGTATGTSLVKDIYPGSNWSEISNAVNFKNTLFFSAANGVNGFELWKSDGTENGTVMVKDIVTGRDGSEPDGLTIHKNELFFVCKKDSTNTDALWKTDGTTNGTVRVKRLFPNGLSNIKNMFSTDTYLYFSATNGVNGTELWRTNGTDTGTVMVFDLNPGAASSNPDNFTFYKNDLFFVADNGTTGRELWRLTSSPNVSVKESATIDIILFPNPTSEYLTIQQEETGTGRSVNLYDNSGKVVISNVALRTASTQIDVHHLPSGLYFLEVREKNNAKNALKKVIITR